MIKLYTKKQWQGNPRKFGNALFLVVVAKNLVRKCVKNMLGYIIKDSVDKAECLWNKIKDTIPSNFKGLEVVGLNERLRFLRYDPGEYFKPHRDGSFVRADNSEKSLITIQLYLSEGFEGGETTFFGPNNEKVSVVPKTGMVLVFEHPLLHEGSLLKSGRKYSMRTDVMYKTDMQ